MATYAAATITGDSGYYPIYAVNGPWADEDGDGSDGTVPAQPGGRPAPVQSQQGEKLDPMKHQAISMVAADQEANTIVTVLQKGYLIAERVLRPALVTVSAPK